MFDRYGRRPEPAIAFMQGFRLRRGAIGTSYNPDFNNVMVLSTNDEDMAVAASCVVGSGGGFVVVDGGEVRASLRYGCCRATSSGCARSSSDTLTQEDQAT
jgi:adenine deaminase